MAKSLKEVISSLVAEIIIQEKLRGTFNIAQFKKITDPDKAYKYALDTLGRPLGSGSSRVVFPLSSGKVLKIAKGMTEAGLAQNQAEVDVATNPKTKPVVAQVYDYDPDYIWIISEITRPFNFDTTKQTIGLDSDTFEELLRFSLEGKTQNFDQAVRLLTKKATDSLKYIEKEKESIEVSKELINSGYWDNNPNAKKLEIDNLHKKEVDLGWIQFEAEKTLRKFKEMNSQRLKPLINGLIAMKEMGIIPIWDIMRMDHYGITGDGRIVLIDYGFTEDIGNKFYNWSVKVDQNKET